MYRYRFVDEGIFAILAGVFNGAAVASFCEGKVAGATLLWISGAVWLLIACFLIRRQGVKDGRGFPAAQADVRPGFYKVRHVQSRPVEGFWFWDDDDTRFVSARDVELERGATHVRLYKDGSREFYTISS